MREKAGLNAAGENMKKLCKYNMKTGWSEDGSRKRTILQESEVFYAAYTYST